MSTRAVIAWQVWLWPALLVAMALGAWAMPWDAWVPSMRDWVQAQGALGSVAFVAIYIVVVMLPLPAAAMSVLGAIPPYLIGRTWLRAALLRRFPGPRVAATDRAISRNAVAFVLLLRVTPVVPFTAQNWLLGLTDIRFWPYVWATLVGLAPGTLAMVWVGEVGGLLTAEVGWARTVLVAGGLLAFGLMMLWLTRVATIELRRAGFDAGR